ncbi:MAG TPA: hypothetical protein VEU94_00150 [Terriglobales bacterium]|nr:hypothetical protein [Terriglobales bacterium]
MHRICFLPLLIMFYVLTSWAQVSPQPGATSNPAAQQAPAGNQLAAGTIISVELSKTLDAKKVKANDKIEARTAMDLLSHGQIIIPRNAKVIGHVTEAKAHTKQSPDSVVGISFDRVLMKDGRELPLQAAVQAIGRPLQTSLPVAGDDSMGSSPNGIPSAAQAQRGTVSGAASPTPPSYPSGYPSRGASGTSQDQTGPVGTSVSPLGSTSQGVVGMRGLSLNSSGATSVLSSNTDNVHLDSGSQLILRVQ